MGKRRRILTNSIVFGASTVVFIDYANVKAWVKDRKLFIDLKVLYDVLKKAGARNVIFYYGTDSRNPATIGFLNKLRSFGYEVVTKPVKYIKIDLLELLNQRTNREILQRMKPEVKKSFVAEIRRLDKVKVNLFSPKANFDVEIALDMILLSENNDHFVLFSGDGDFVPIVRYLRGKGKRVIVVSGRKFLAGELLEAADTFLTLERFSQRVKGLLKKQDLPKERS